MLCGSWSQVSNLLYSSRGLTLDYALYAVTPLVELTLNLFTKTLVHRSSGGGGGLPCGAHAQEAACVGDAGCGWCSTGKGLCLELNTLPAQGGGGVDSDVLGLCSPCALFSKRSFSSAAAAPVDSGALDMASACLEKAGCGVCASFGRNECHAGDEAGFIGTWRECAGVWRAPASALQPQLPGA